MSPSTSTLGNPLDQASGAHRSPLAHRARIALVLALACGAGSVMLMPYLAAMLPELQEAPLPLWALGLLSGLQNGVLCGVLALLGLGAAQTLGLKTDHLARWINRTGTQPGWSGLGSSLLIGGGIAVLVVIVDLNLMLPSLTLVGEAPPTPGPLHGLLASFYGGIAEEVIVRLFLLSVVAWGLVKVGVGKRAALLSAALVAALAFGALHLPTAVQIFAFDGALVARTIVLNAMLGLPFGLIFIKRGLEQAIAAHFVADLVLHVAVPALTLAGVMGATS